MKCFLNAEKTCRPFSRLLKEISPFRQEQLFVVKIKILYIVVLEKLGKFDMSVNSIFVNELEPELMVMALSELKTFLILVNEYYLVSKNATYQTF